MSLRSLCLVTLLLCAGSPAFGQGRDAATPTHADSVRGADNPTRAWWDVTFYDLHVRVTPADSSVVGWDGITYRVRQPGQMMQLDLQAPLELDSAMQDGQRLQSRRDGNAYFLTLPARSSVGETRTVTAYYHGQPGRGRSGQSSGVIWSTDSLGAPWFATSDELPGASIWWPLKDWLGDEPDSQRIAITVPDSLMEVSNGRLRRTTHHPNGTTTYEWFVTQPINSYGVAMNAGRYAHFADTLQGEGGRLSLDFWPLAAHLDTAKVQWAQVRPMLTCFEHWFGPYPWYADGYKLIETPYLGMEHQSGIAYGNKFLPGYLGRDLSRTGLGLEWDYIVIHESAHEWFGNSISTREPGDLWVHESFATYAEGLYTECRHGRAAGATYLIGLRQSIRNSGPIVGPRGVAGWYNSDMYFKGANVLHTIRQLVDDDAKWLAILRGLTQTFRHRTVTGAEIEDYIGRASGLDLRQVFAQYLTTPKVPELEYRVEHGMLSYRWAGVLAGFAMPVRVQIPGLGQRWLRPTAEWQRLKVPSPEGAQVVIDENFYVTARNLAARPATSDSASATADQVRDAFLHAWRGYRRYAWGHDELDPLSRKPHDWYGTPLLMTPVDGYDTMRLMALDSEAADAKRLILERLSFDRDVSVQVFEVTIRLLGGLLSAYQLDHDRRFLALATDLGDRLLPAFRSATGMPFRYVNLRTGATREPVSNPAEIGTLMLEFGTLAKLTGRMIYYDTAKRAVQELFRRRSPIGLVGSTIDVRTGAWQDSTSHIGGGIDSWYEYLLKSWRLFGDGDFERMWQESVGPMNRYLADDRFGGLWYGQANMATGVRIGTQFGSLEAFLPAVLALGGDTARAARLMTSVDRMWTTFGVEPEVLDYSTMAVGAYPGYELRPEALEAAYYLFRLTGDIRYRQMGEAMWRAIDRWTRTPDGFAALADVRTKVKRDRMQSFLFAETMKYAWLLLAPPTALDLQTTVLTTEAHPLRRTW
ncbi:MAG TPA: glycoside hydrolase family 47 protein [Gemmatimonadales bacterium]|jgi:hypothetical protein